MTDPDPIVRPGRLNPFLAEILQSREEAIERARAAQEEVGRLLKAIDDLARALTLRGGVAASIADELRRAVAGPDLEPDPAAGPHTVIAQWEAVVAVFGVDNGDGRMLDPAGEWAPPERPVPLTTLPDGATPGRVVGRVDRTWRDGDRLCAAGEVWDPTAAQAMFQGHLFPGIDISAPAGSRPAAEADMYAGLLRFRDGRLRALALVPEPTWAEHVRFYPPGNAAPPDRHTPSTTTRKDSQ